MNARTTSFRSGFTLIELLVVIAIIGILSAVVLSAVGAAKNKSGDASVQSDLDSIKEQAEIYFNTNTTYGTSSLSCSSGLFSDSVVTSAIANANANGSGTTICNSNGSAYVVESGLKTAGGYWCVDSTENVKKETAAITSSATVACP